MMDKLDAQGRHLVATLNWAPDWAVSLGLMLLALLVAAAVHETLIRILKRLAKSHQIFWRSLTVRGSGPMRLALVILALSIATSLAPMTFRQADTVHHILLVCFIGLLGWLTLTALNIWTSVYLSRFKIDTEDNLLARKHVTQSRILQRVAATLIVVITIAAALMTFNSVRQYGVSLLASAGAAGLVVGLALQPLLKNLVAGIQLAITQPIRLEDAVIVEGEWGNVEEISATYVVVRLWDWRRMVLPLSYFIEHPFQNWTRESSSLIGAVMLYVDYTAPVGEMRQKLEEIAKESPIWDGRVVNLQVTDFKTDTMEIRMLVSAANAGNAFDLRCRVRETMIAWLQAEYPNALPHRRAEIDNTRRGKPIAADCLAAE